MGKTRGYLQKLNAKGKLNEKEATRLKTYEARLAKKDVEQASLEQRQLQMKAPSYQLRKTPSKAARLR